MDNNTNPEAREWLKSNKNPSAFASNRFGSTGEALAFIEKLYELGAEKVLIDNIFDEESRIEKEGGPYADSILIKMPNDPVKRSSLYKVYNSEAVNEGFEEIEGEGSNSLTLWWD
ncbi:MAG: hypothetical protein ABIE03_05355 [Patescibacteria group bacterium]|nr:hypothetical protein [Patescibacteria group bacterium]